MLERIEFKKFIMKKNLETKDIRELEKIVVEYIRENRERLDE